MFVRMFVTRTLGSRLEFSNEDRKVYSALSCNDRKHPGSSHVSETPVTLIPGRHRPDSLVWKKYIKRRWNFHNNKSRLACGINLLALLSPYNYAGEKELITRHVQTAAQSRKRSGMMTSHILTARSLHLSARNELFLGTTCPCPS
jgi:hypothetical protein